MRKWIELEHSVPTDIESGEAEASDEKGGEEGEETGERDKFRPDSDKIETSSNSEVLPTQQNQLNN